MMRADRLTPLVYSTQEPLLWIPDALGWCYGARGDWRRRVAAAINAVIDCAQL